MECTKKIKAIINAIDRKLNASTVNLSSAVKLLCDSYTATKASDYTPINTTSGSVQVQSIDRIKAVLDIANQKTGYNDSTLTEAVQRLCNGYDRTDADGKYLYTFGVLSDLHIQYETGLADFQRALEYLSLMTSFTCICGDLVSYATAENMAQYKTYVDTYAGNMPVYECAGNHETYPDLGVGGELDVNLWRTTTGKDPYYSFSYGNDVFIFLSLKSERANDLFVDGGLTWLAETLEANKNKRCFVFQHVQDPADNTADPSHKYSPILNGTSGSEFLRLIKKYKNTVWFHGHTHLTFNVEQYPVSEDLGYRSVHIPSLSGPRFYNKETNSLENYYFDENNNKIWGSELAEGYMVNVYENCIKLICIDFATGENKDTVSIKSESYIFDTTLQEIIN